MHPRLTAGLVHSHQDDLMRAADTARLAAVGRPARTPFTTELTGLLRSLTGRVAVTLRLSTSPFRSAPRG